MNSRSLKIRGLTLIELVMTIALVGILVGVTTLSIREVIGLYDFWSFRSESATEARLAMTLMAREIRQIHNDTSVVLADQSRLQFNISAGSTIDYQLNGTDLMRNSDVLAKGVTNLTFGYYNVTKSLLSPLPLNETNIAEIYLVSIVLGISSGNQNKTLETVIGPRNY